MNIRILSIGVLACWLLASGCASYVRVARMAPAEVELPGVENLAVGQFDGPDGTGLNHAFIRELRKSSRFEILDREVSVTLLQEPKLSVDEAVATKDDRSDEGLPATLVVTGAVLSADYQEEAGRVESTCSRTGSNGKTQSYKCYHRTRHGMLYYEANMNLVNSATGKLILSRAFARSMERTTTAERARESAPGIDRHHLLEGCRDEVAQLLANLIVPHSVYERVRLEQDDELPSLEKGNEHAKANQWNEAIDAYQAALAHARSKPDLDKESVGRAYYSMGLALAMTGKYDQALLRLAAAVALYPDRDWQLLQGKVVTWKEDATRVEAQLGEKPSLASQN